MTSTAPAATADPMPTPPEATADAMDVDVAPPTPWPVRKDVHGTADDYELKDDHSVRWRRGFVVSTPNAVAVVDDPDEFATMRDGNQLLRLKDRTTGEKKHHPSGPNKGKEMHTPFDRWRAETLVVVSSGVEIERNGEKVTPMWLMGRMVTPDTPDGDKDYDDYYGLQCLIPWTYVMEGGKKIRKEYDHAKYPKLKEWFYENCTPEHAACVAKAIEFYTQVATCKGDLRLGKPEDTHQNLSRPRAPGMGPERPERVYMKGPRPTDATEAKKGHPPRVRQAWRSRVQHIKGTGPWKCPINPKWIQQQQANGGCLPEPWELENNERGLTLVQPDVDASDGADLRAAARAAAAEVAAAAAAEAAAAEAGPPAAAPTPAPAPAAAPAAGLFVPLPAAGDGDQQPLPPHLAAEILSDAEPLPACRRLRITVKDLPATGVQIDAAADRPGQLTIRFPEPDATARTAAEVATVDRHTLALLNSVASQEVLETDAGPMRILHITADPRHELMAGTTRAGEAHPHLALRDPASDRILAVSTTCVVLDMHTPWPEDRKAAYLAMRREMASAHARAEALQRELDKQQQQTRKRAREDDGADGGDGGAAVAGSQLLDQLLDLVDARRQAAGTHADKRARPAAAADDDGANAEAEAASDEEDEPPPGM